MSTPRWLPLATATQVRQEVHRASRGVRGYFIGAVVVTTAAALLDLAVPMATGWIIDAARAHRPPSSLLTPALVMAAAVIGSGICNGAAQTLTPSFFTTIVTRLREAMIESGLGLDQQRVERAGTADLVSRASDDVTAVRDAANGALPRLVNTMIMVIVSVGALASLHPAFFIPVLLAAVLYGLAIREFLRTAPPVYRAERRASTTQSQHILSTIHGLDVVRAFGLENLRTRTVAAGSWQAIRWNLRGRFLGNTLVVRLLAGEAVATIGVSWTGYLLVTGHRLSVGAAATAILVLLRLFSPVRFLLMFLNNLQAAWVCLQRVIGVIHARHEEPAAIEYTHHGPTSVHVDRLSFGYQDGPDVVREVSLDIPAGHTMVLVGQSGAGKSTVAALVAGLLEPRSGQIVMSPGRARTVLISQEIHTFSGSLLDDVALGLPATAENWSEDQVRQAVVAALEQVGAEWVGTLPDGVDTVVGRLGTRLSPAQAQQVALARALLADPPVIILDEATAEAGTSGAAALDRAALEVVKGRTALVVAHRLSQVAMADEIAVMEDGRIIEVGPVEQLRHGDGPFSRLWQVWSNQR
ncbi:ABC transporter ATP-binding protein [Cutibacterium avidum]|uniref:ABC transporter ATP-binding protein n=1 Tax=Cutibacterium avidum TaxID=33010 RepID=UPI00083E7D8F|nr:ABC transporter ATP-binding protein [Cutibacterium avidum]AOG28246.1 ABC transporter [Cutibacterium avidum]QQY15870.1 ABC transporter ATP-binding protein [Cutibacterium avidum]